MKFVPTTLTGAHTIELEPLADERGLFARTWSREELLAHGLVADVSQCSLSRTSVAGTVRGLHFQRAPHEEVKIVRCTRGVIYDVIVDLRGDSPTYCAWEGFELDAERGTALYVPKGFGHGFQTLVDDVEVQYMMSDPYVSEASTGVRWNDPAFGVEWPLEVRVISERDRSWPDHPPKR